VNWIWDRETWVEDLQSHYLHFNVSIKVLAGDLQQSKSEFIYSKLAENLPVEVFNTAHPFPDKTKLSFLAELPQDAVLQIQSCNLCAEWSLKSYFKNW